MPSADAGFDVAIAADFSAPLTAVRAEVQTLFFLGSWLERAGRRTRETCPLHLACVGEEPPDSVAALAAQAGARVSLHEPLAVPEAPENGRRAFHRLRALDAGPFATGRVLLLDSSVLVMDDPRLAFAGLPADALASSPADRALLPNAAWPALYHAVGLEPPTTRMRALRAELELPPRHGPPAFEDQAAQSAAMFPCYDAGVLFLPAAAAGTLRETWAAHAAALAGSLAGDPSLPLTEKERAKLAGNPRISLATAHQALLAGGGQTVQSWQRLPAGCDTRMAHFQGGALEFNDVKLLRAGEFFHGLADPSQIQARLRAAGDLWRSAIIEGRQRNAGIDRWADDGARARLRRWRAGRASRRAERWLRELYVRHVRPSLRAAGHYA